MSEEKPQLKIGILKRVLALASPYRGIFYGLLFMAIILAPIATLRPTLIQQMVDRYIITFDWDGLKWMTMLLIGVLVVESGLTYVFQYGTSWLGQTVIRDLRVRVFRHILSLKLTYFDRTAIGTSTTRTISDIQTINDIFSQGAISIVADVFKLIAVLAVMLYTSWKLTLVCLTVLPVLILASYIFKEKVKASFQRVRTQISRMNAFLQERISGMRVIQMFNAEKQEIDKFKTINRDYTGANLDAILYYAIFFPVVEIISAASLGLMVWYGARGVISEEVTIGTLIAFPIWINMLFRPIRTLADKFNTLQMGMVAADRVFKLIDNNSQIQNEGTHRPTSIDGKVEFENVLFAYTGEDYVLKNISFDIEAGKTLAIVGSTGSGKSTIINLLGRFYEINGGSIRIDDVELQDYALENLRSHIGVVLQDVFLFSGSVLENITLRDESISRESVIASAKMIGAHEFIERLPGGYDYQVMERGATLSMGQRQLISFVRALIFDPEILILDEATSSIDPESESVIQYAIEKLIEKRTSIIIAHRLSTIRHADAIMVLKHGEIMEIGSHEELVEKEGGHYRELYELQFMEAEEL